MNRYKIEEIISHKNCSKEELVPVLVKGLQELLSQVEVMESGFESRLNKMELDIIHLMRRILYLENKAEDCEAEYEEIKRSQSEALP